MTARELLKKATKELKEIPVSEPDASAEFLLRHVLNQDRSSFYASLDKEVTERERKQYEKLLALRKRHEPVWQIVGKVEFWGLDFVVNKNVLVPRPETEFLVSEVLKKISKFRKKEPSILDVGTGAGTIIVSLTKELKKGKFYASDVSEKALSVAKKNAKLNSTLGKITFKKGYLLKPWGKRKFDVICANLPYIPHEDLPGLTVEIYHYEPRIALDGGNGGLVLYKELLKNTSDYLNEDGMVFCEIGKGQGKKFQDLAKKYLPEKKCIILHDLAGFDRIGIIS